MSDSEFIDLCTRVLDGTAAAEDIRRWNDRLAIDPRQRGLYRDFCDQQVWIEEELAGAPPVLAGHRVRRVATARRLAAAAAVVVTAGAWWWQRGDAVGRAQSDGSMVTIPLREPADGAPSAFVYPFEGFPTLQPETLEPDANSELRVVALDEIDPRIMTIARQLADSESPGDPEL